MADDTSPSMPRRRLRTVLRNARLEKGLTQEQVAAAMDWSMSKMNRIEQAKSGISTNDLRELLRYYGIPERDKELLDLARVARRPGWWREYKDVGQRELLELIDYEHAASSVSQFETMFVPGILQTDEYASAILHGFHDAKSDDQLVDKRVKLRIRRRDLLTSVDAPHFDFIMDESVIHRVVEGPDVMNRQFQHLVTMAERPNITIRIVPFTAGLHPGMRGPFEVVQFEDASDDNLVFVEGPRGDFVSGDPGETGSYLDRFRHIMEVSLEPKESVELLRNTAGETA